MNDDQAFFREMEGDRSPEAWATKNRRAWFRSQTHMRYFRIDLTVDPAKAQVRPKGCENN